MFGKLNMLGKLQEMKQKADEIKKELDNKIIRTEGAGGDIRLEISGNRQIKKLEIADALQHGDKKELEEQLCKTFNKAIQEADKASEEEMKKAASGLLPGL
jgi:nucleoid-associated protein EbfC